MERFYFMHIAKTAGTSFRSIIEAQFAEDAICPPSLTHQLAEYMKGDVSVLEPFTLFRGHLGFSLIPLLPASPHTITMLREPVQRTLSHYEHIIRHENHWMRNALPPHCTLEDFLAFAPARNLIRDFQVRNLALAYDLTAPIKVDKKVIQPNLGRLLSCVPDTLQGDALLERAWQHLESFAFFGITERFAESLALLAETFGWDTGAKERAAPPRLNTAPRTALKKEDLSPAALAQIQELTALDSILYERAQKLFATRLSAMQTAHGGKYA